MRRSIPSIQGLICFESAAKHLSYTYAAQELCITQSAVSRQIQQLEDFLGVELFIRTRHGVELTIAGQQYFKSIKPYLLGEPYRVCRRVNILRDYPDDKIKIYP